MFGKLGVREWEGLLSEKKGTGRQRGIHSHIWFQDRIKFLENGLIYQAALQICDRKFWISIFLFHELALLFHNKSQWVFPPYYIYKTHDGGNVTVTSEVPSWESNSHLLFMPQVLWILILNIYSRKLNQQNYIYDLKTPVKMTWHLISGWTIKDEYIKYAHWVQLWKQEHMDRH